MPSSHEAPESASVAAARNSASARKALISFFGTTAMVIAAAGILAASAASASDEKPNAVEGGAKKTGRAIDHAAERTADKTEAWVRKKTE
jgi:hypothetical protein